MIKTKYTILLFCLLFAPLIMLSQSKAELKYSIDVQQSNASRTGFYLVADTNAIRGNSNQAYSDCGTCDARFHVLAFNYYNKNIAWTLVSAPVSYNSCGTSYYVDSHNCIDEDCTFHMHGVSPGEYIIAARDLDDPDSLTTVVSDTISIYIRAVNNGSVIVSANNLLCYSDQSGSIALQSNLPGPLTYNWSNNSSNSSITGLNAGTYTVTVTDFDKCNLEEKITISEPAAITIQPVLTNNIVPGPNVGAINLTINGGTPSYYFQWSNGSITQNINQLAAGTYTVTITDANNCSENRMYRLAEDSIQSTGIHEYDLNSLFSVQPNPFNKSLNLIFTEKFKDLDIRVFNMIGNLVFENKTVNDQSLKKELNLSFLPPGIYLLKITGNRLNKTVRLIKQ